MGTRAAQFDFLISGYTDPNTGLVGAGYHVYFLAAGTATPKDVWTSYDKSGGAVQTIDLDATGSAAVWGDGVYNVVIKNLSGATTDTFVGIKVQWPAHNVVTTTSATLQITTDMTEVLADPTGTNQVLTMPLASTCDHPITVKRIAGGSNSVTIVPTSPDTLDGAATYGITTLNGDVTWFTDGATWYGKAVASTNADTLSGYSVSETAVAATIPLRDANAKLAGSVLGYAEGGYGGAYGLAMSALKILYTNATTATITADAIALSDGTNQRVFTAWNNTVVVTTAGAGGLDTGAEANSTWYHIWAIAKEDGTKSVIMSVSATAPTMPADYVYKRRIGTVFNDGSGNFRPFVQYGNRTQFTNATKVLATTAVGLTQANWTAAAVRGALKIVPATAFIFYGSLGVYSASGDTLVAPNASYGDATTAMMDDPANTAMPVPIYGFSNAAVTFEFILESDNIYWASDNTASAISCHGYADNF